MPHNHTGLSISEESRVVTFPSVGEDAFAEVVKDFLLVAVTLAICVLTVWLPVPIGTFSPAIKRPVGVVKSEDLW